MRNFDLKLVILASAIEDHQLVQWYLMCSYLYYCRNLSLLADHEYDVLCQRLHQQWNKIKHPHKSFIDRTALTAATGYYLREEQYPDIVVSAANGLARRLGIA